MAAADELTRLTELDRGGAHAGEARRRVLPQAGAAVAEFEVVFASSHPERIDGAMAIERLAALPLDPPLHEIFAFIRRRNARLSPATRALMTLPSNTSSSSQRRRRELRPQDVGIPGGYVGGQERMFLTPIK